MSDEYKIINKTFHHVVLEGTAFEVGQQQAEIIKKHRPESVKWCTSANVDPKKLGFNSFEELQSFYEEYCPGITDELEGFADSLGVKPDKLPMYTSPIYEPGNCSHIAVLPSATDTKHTYVARSYEFNQDFNDFRLCTVRIKGKPKTIGFSDFTVFRDDGMNSHGFSVTLSGGGTLKRKPTKKGFPFFLVVRALLDNSKTVDEALEYLGQVPVNGFWNFIVTDKNGNAALAQFFDGEVSIKQIDSDSPEPFLYVNNHYVLPDMVKYNKYAGDWILANSTKRFELIASTLRQTNPTITKETLRGLLSKEVYEGLAGHYYTDYFGTLFSFIFDLAELKADVCFGTPLHNDWHTALTLDDPKGVNLYESVFPDKSVTHDDLWTG